VKKLIAFVAIVLLAASAQAQAAKPRSKVNPATAGKILAEQEGKQAMPEREMIEFYEREMLEADKKGDWDAIARRMADDFLEISGNGGYYTKAEIAKLFPESRVTDYKISEIEFRPLGAEAALLAYRLDLQATFQGKALPGAFRISSVWQKRAGEWKVVFHQGTPIPAQ
jgi:glyoxylase I family protein